MQFVVVPGYERIPTLNTLIHEVEGMRKPNGEGRESKQAEGRCSKQHCYCSNWQEQSKTDSEYVNGSDAKETLHCRRAA